RCDPGPNRCRLPSGEAIARQGRDDDVESSLRATSVRGWIRKWIDDLELLDDGSGPAMRDDDREHIRMTRTDVDEVNVHAIDRRDELRQGIQPRFRLAPVVAAAPVAYQLLQLGQLSTLRLIRDGFL